MRRRTSPEHLDDEALLAYLDGEVSAAPEHVEFVIT